jgi:sugar phosphate isomerase/epimerase
MKFGICCPAESAADAIAAGFDYAEVAAATLPEKVAMLEGLPIDATNLFFPGSFRLFEPTVGDYIGHAVSVIEAAARLHTQVMVIGSGAQRTSGPGVEPEAGLERFVEIVAEIAEVAFAHGISIAPESLTRDETNVANDLPTMAFALQKRGLGYTADSFHVLRECFHEGIEPDWSAQVPFAPTHVHFADLPRNVPALDDHAVLGFFARLKELGYDSRISFEGSLGMFELRAAGDQIRTLWESA